MKTPARFPPSWLLSAVRAPIARGLALALATGLLTPKAPGASLAPLDQAVSVRVENGYAIVSYADGSKTLVPLRELSPDKRAQVEALAAGHPLAHGRSRIISVPTTEVAKKTIVSAATEDGVESVRLCPPSVFRDQTGSYCALYARIHWLDIAGYYVKAGDAAKIEGLPAAPDNPWSNPRYGPALDELVAHYVPKSALHRPPPEAKTFERIRGEIRRGRPVFAALTHEIWQALPPEFIAAHGWDGGKEGHAIVVNGFTWNRATGAGSFHIVNSWKELYEFDLPVANAEGMLAYPASLSAKGAIETPDAPDRVERITLLQTRGQTNLYEVRTNHGTRRVLAPSAAAARALVESDAP